MFRKQIVTTTKDKRLTGYFIFFIKHVLKKQNLFMFIYFPIYNAFKTGILFVHNNKSTEIIMIDAFYISFEIPVCGTIVPLVAKVHTVQEMKVYHTSSIVFACGNYCISLSCNV